MERITKIIQEASFPKSGNHFAIVYKPRERVYERGGFEVRVTIDRSFSENVFMCLESDAVRVVARVVHGFDYRDGQTYTFLREDCRFDDVTHLLPSLGFAIKEPQS